MKTITFYSYKGGVGRTLALANVATYLSRFGQRVCILDFDLEAPGLHYKFPHLVKTQDLKCGLVDYIYTSIIENRDRVKLSEFSLPLIAPEKSFGEVRLIPAGNVLSSNYWHKLAAIDWHHLFYDEVSSDGVPFFLNFKEKIRKEFAPDFLLIDSRTGITEMSGLCTSLLPDDVVFFIVNNQENIEGARQILRSLQKAPRIHVQEPIKVTFILTRIPFPRDEKETELEEGIVRHIQDFLNEPMEELESQLSIRDICILHSDRELELSESLTMGQERVSKEKPLLRDYLRLFRKIVPEEVILSKLDSILDEITATANLLENPDKTQQELEELVDSYPDPKSFEKLIDFYILRNEENEKILARFHELWRTYKIDNRRMLSKYIARFMKTDIRYWRHEPEFEFEIVEKYLDSDPQNKVEVEMKLADAYTQYRKTDMALKHYKRLLDKTKEKNYFLGRIIDIYRERNLFEDAIELCQKYSDIIDKDVSLRLKKLQVLFKTGNLEQVRKLLDDGGITESALIRKDSSLYIKVMESLGQSNKVTEKLNEILEEALKDGPTELYEVGKIFSELGRAVEFKETILRRHPDAPEVLRELDRRRGRQVH